MKTIKSIVVRILDKFWDTKSPEETKKFFGLSIAAFFLLGSSWPLRIAKDSLLVTELGAGFQPIIKAIAILACFPLTLLYSTAVCFISGETVLYIVALGYAFLGGILALAIQYSIFYKPSFMGVLVNIFYIYSESFAAVSIAPFWAFVNDISKPQEASRKYSMIVFFAQFGGLVFTFLSRSISRNLSSQIGHGSFVYKFAAPVVTVLACCLMLLFALVLYLTVRSVNRKGLEGYIPRSTNAWASKAREKSLADRFSSGLEIITTSPYVLGLLLMTSFQEIVSTVMHYNVLKAAQNSFALKSLQSCFIEDYLLLMQFVSVIFSIRISSWVTQKMGVRNSLMAYPIILMFLFPMAFYLKTAWFVAIIVALEKGLHYAINRPNREILYIPTSHEIKYQAKGWIDIFGTRAAKLTGASMNKFMELFGVVFAPLILAIPFFWVFVAHGVGKKYQSTIDNGAEINERT